MANVDRTSLWAWALALWAAATLSFMAGMGIGSTVFVLTCLWYLRKEKIWPVLKKEPLLWVSLGLLLAALLSIVSAHLAPPLGLPLQNFRELQKFHYFLLPFFTAFALLKTSGPKLEFEKHPLWKALCAMALLVSVVSILQFWGGYLFPESWRESRFFRSVATGEDIAFYHAQGLMYFHLSFASAMGFVCSYVGARLLWPLATDGKKEKILWAVLLLFTSLAFFYTYSRISWVALGALFVALFFLKRPSLGVAAVLAVVIGASLVWHFSPTVRGRWHLARNAIVERQQVWAGAREMIADRPWLGVGFGKTGYYSTPYATRAIGSKPIFSSHAHNNFLDILAATGVVGLVPFLLWWIVLWIYGWRSFWRSPENERWLPGACLAAFVTFHVNGLTQVNFFDAKSQHSLMLWAGILLALEWRRRARSEII